MTEVQDRLEATFQKVREKTGQEQKRQKTYYDRKIHGNPLEEGELVWLWNPAIPSRKTRLLLEVSPKLARAIPDSEKAL